MVVNTVYLATLPNGFFGSAGESWKTLDLEKMTKTLRSLGFCIKFISIDKLFQINFIDTDVVIYTSSDEPAIRGYLRDVMYFVSRKCTIIPNYESLLAHENKGFQQLFREEIGFGNLKGGYVFDVDDFPVRYPFVYKNVIGAGSSGVRLVENKDDIRRVKSKYFNVGFKRKIIKLVRRLKLTKEEYKIYGYRHKGFNLSVYQELVPDLAYDYKVLAFGCRYYVLKRAVRKNDFRASGSGNFLYENAPEVLLNYADAVFKMMDVPYASLDIIVAEGVCHLIEYQTLNFGPYTLVNSPGHYIKIAGGWQFCDGCSELNECFSYALSSYFEKKNYVA